MKGTKSGLPRVIWLALLAGILITISPSTAMYKTQQSKDCDPTTIQTLILSWKDRLEKDTDQFPEIVNEFVIATYNCNDPSLKAIMISMMAEMYQIYYNSNRWDIMNRTHIEGDAPSDIRLWSSNLFEKRISETLKKSIFLPESLKQTSLDDYKELLIHDENTIPLGIQSLYDFLMYRMVEIAYDQELTNQWLEELKQRDDQTLFVQVKLIQLAELHGRRYTAPSYQKELQELYETYKDSPLSVEIAQSMWYADYRLSETQKDSISALEYNQLKGLIDRFPDYPRINLIKNRFNNLTQPSLTVNTPKNVYPNGKLKISLNYSNITSVTIDICESTSDVFNTQRSYGEISKRGKLIKQVMLVLPEKPAWKNQGDTAIYVQMGKAGLYDCFISPDKHPELKGQTTFSVSKLGLIHRSDSEGGIQAIVTDFISGKPVDNATVIVYTNKDNKWIESERKETEKDGIVEFSNLPRYAGIRAVMPNDTSTLINQLYTSRHYTSSDQTNRLDLYTDRTIYRPGQTVYLKGIAYQQEGNQSSILAEKPYTLNLYDTSGSVVKTQEVRTNAYGSFSAEFILPKVSSTGTFRIQGGEGVTRFRVEEYKRPSFIVNIDSLKENAIFSHPVTLQGNAKTYSGISLNKGTVNYEVYLQRMPWIRPYASNISDGLIDSGEVTLNEQGEFSFTFTPKKEETNTQIPNFYRYEIVARVTDSKGETQEGRYSFAVGDKEFSLQTNLEELVKRSEFKLKIDARTQQGKTIDVSGEYQIIEMVSKDNDPNAFKKGNTIQEGAFHTADTAIAELFTTLPSGKYMLKLTAKDKNNELIEYDTQFILYDEDDKRPPVFSQTWTPQRSVSILGNEQGTYHFGTSYKNVYALHELFMDNQLVKREWIRLDNEIESFRFTLPEENKMGGIASFTFIKDGDVHSEQISLLRKQPDRNLRIKPTSFRDHLLPGQRETWTFTILDALGSKPQAEVLASMYDFSLDKIQPFEWYFSPWRSARMPFSPFRISHAFSNDYAYLYGSQKYLEVPEFSFFKLNWQGVNHLLSSRLELRSLSTPAPSAKGVSDNVSLQSTAQIEAGILDEDVAEEAPISEAAVRSDAASQSAESLRKNFQETAFFYPHLVQKDSLSFTFVLPESNTTWKLQMLAHTKDLFYGQYTALITASKKLMVSPNLPRFVREGDKVSISTQILNSLDTDVTGDVRLSLFDPITGEAFPIVEDSIIAIHTKKQSTDVVTWRFTAPHGISLLGCKIIADTDQASDGEQHLIPVLPEALPVIESKPFMLDGKKEHTVQLPALGGGSKKPYRATIEVASNPIWYAIQALPALTEPKSEDAISWLGVYYAATLTHALLEQNPRIEQVIAAWKASATDQDILLSNLEKDEELKTILLQETPWVMDAKNQTDSRQRLIQLFDKNQTEPLRAQALKQLQRLQRPDGGWSWYEGFVSNAELSVEVLQAMAQLIDLNAVEYGQTEKEMQMKALRYVDEFIGHLYKSMEEKGNVMVTPFVMDYLYMRSSYRDIPETESARIASKAYTSLILKQFEKSFFPLQSKGKAALLLHRNGDKENAQKIVAWLKRTATTNSKGMYWANNRASSRGINGSVIHTHTTLMRALQEIAPNQKETNRMKYWLLGQKRIQEWASTPATLSAIYQLIETGDDWLSQSNECEIKWGDLKLNTRDGELATGYIKHSVDAGQLTPGMNQLKISCDGEAPIWGAAFVQYFQLAKDIKSSASNYLSVEKQLYKEVVKEGKKILQPVQKGEQLHVGDRVTVRMAIRAASDCDFIYLKDLRPACFEPANQLSNYEYIEGALAYHTSRDAAEEYFFDYLPQGTYVIEYQAYVNREGTYSEGTATIQSLYAKELTQHTSGATIQVAPEE